MRIGLILLFITLLSQSCTDRYSDVHDSFIGEWEYSREHFTSFSGGDGDESGTITFNEDESGLWISDQNTFVSDLSIEWDLQRDDTKIAITKSSFLFGTTRIYDIVDISDNTIIINVDIELTNLIDTIPDFIDFENIILTRI